MDGVVAGDKGKSRAQSQPGSGDEAMWAVVLTKELWRKGVWDDAKSVSIVALGCFHPTLKVQSASIHFFLGTDEEEESSDDDEEVRGALVSTTRR